MTKHFNSIVLTLFFWSGFAVLCYEISWIRSSSQIFGPTTFVVSSVVSLLFTGMALGTHHFYGRSWHYQEPLKLYDRPTQEYDTSRTSYSPQRFKKLFEEQQELPDR